MIFLIFEKNDYQKYLHYIRVLESYKKYLFIKKINKQKIKGKEDIFFEQSNMSKQPIID